MKANPTKISIGAVVATFALVVTSLWAQPTPVQPGVTKLVAGTGITLSPASGLGTVTINATSTGGVSSITGTSGQITASAGTGAVTLSLPSALTGIASITAPAGLTLASTGANNVVVGGGGALGATGTAFINTGAAGIYLWNNGSNQAHLLAIDPGVVIMDLFVRALSIELQVSGNQRALLLASDKTATFPSLAGTGTRAVVVDANGKMSAP